MTGSTGSTNPASSSSGTTNNPPGLTFAALAKGRAAGLQQPPSTGTSLGSGGQPNGSAFPPQQSFSSSLSASTSIHRTGPGAPQTVASSVAAAVASKMQQQNKQPGNTYSEEILQMLKGDAMNSRPQQPSVVNNNSQQQQLQAQLNRMSLGNGGGNINHVEDTNQSNLMGHLLGGGNPLAVDGNGGNNRMSTMSHGFVGASESGNDPSAMPELSSAVSAAAQQHQIMQQQLQANPASIFGLGGLLNVIRMTDPTLNSLALGTDLTALGLDLNSPDPIYPSFLSPWAENKNNLDHILPQCYNVQPPPPAINKISLFSDETLFYIFYSMPRDEMQNLAAQELYNRQWKYHKELKVWLTKDPLSESTVVSGGGNGNMERGDFIFFDVLGWEKIKKEFVLVWDQIENRPVNKPLQQ